MQPIKIKEKLNLLIEEASTVDPNLAIRLNQINLWIKDVKPGTLMSKKFVMLFLQQFIQDADAWLKLKSLPSEEERQLALDTLQPTLKYWYGYLFPKWLSKNDSKFFIWRRKLMAGDFSQEDGKLIDSIADTIKQSGGVVVTRYIVDLSMATDIIVSSSQNKPLCVQITSISEEFLQEKLNHWENTLLFWEIERGLLLSYNPSANDFIGQIVNTALDNSDNLNTGIYCKLNL